MKTLWDEYVSILNLPTCSYGAGSFFVKFIGDQQVLQFLMRLNDEFKTARGNILMMQPLPNMNQAYRLILQEEKQRENHNAMGMTQDAAALASAYSRNFGRNFSNQELNKFNRQGFNRNTNSPIGTKPTHEQNVVYGITPSERRSKYYCDHCKIYGHSVERCFKIHGYRNNFKGKKIAGSAQGEYEDNCYGNTDLPTVFYGNSDSKVKYTHPTSEGDSTALTKEQYQQLISLLEHHKMDTITSDHHHVAPNGPHAFMKGPQNEIFSGAW